MSILSPLTAGSDVARALPNIKPSNKTSVMKPELGGFAPDIVKISTLGKDKQQQETQMAAESQIDKIANEVIRINSSIGKSTMVGNLTNSQASNLYEKIAQLL